MSVNLQHFSGNDLRLSTEEARKVLKFFFPNDNIDYINITDEDRSFAQALLVEAIDASEKMGYVQIIFEEFETPPNDFGFIKELAKKFMKQALVNWFRNASGKSFSDPKIYLTVRQRLSINFRSTWKIRLETDELTY
jgi:hypothetical protein